jgi:hypothetical protein
VPGVYGEGGWQFFIMKRYSQKKLEFKEEMGEKMQLIQRKASDMYGTMEGMLIDFDKVDQLKREEARKEMEIKRTNIGKKPWFAERDSEKLKE